MRQSKQEKIQHLEVINIKLNQELEEKDKILKLSKGTLELTAKERSYQYHINELQSEIITLQKMVIIFLENGAKS